MDLSKYYKVVGGFILAVIVVTASYFGIVSFTQKKALAKSDQQIEKLVGEINQLKGEKIAAVKEKTEALDAFQEQKDRADTAEKKLAHLKPVKVPTVVSATMSQDCIDQIQLVKQEYDARELVFMDVIKEKDSTIALAQSAITKLQDEIAIDDKAFAKYNEKDKITNAKFVILENKASSEESKKKIYRATSGTLLLVVIALLL